MKALGDQGLGFQPLREVPGWQDHRHAIVEVRDEVVGRGRDDGAGVDRRALSLVPPLPQTGEGERSAVREMDEVGLLAITGPDPFVEAIGRDQTASALDCRSDRGSIPL